MAACVIGAGPAGVCAALCLLRKGIRCNWIDQSFKAGRLSLYNTVPANTKLDIVLGEQLFDHPIIQDVASKDPRVEDAIKRIASTSYRLPRLEQRDPTNIGWTTLGHVGDAYEALTNYMVENYRDALICHYATVDSVHKKPDGSWTVTISNGSSMEASSVVMCTGSVPSMPMHIPASKLIPLDDALCLERLAAVSLSGQRIAVVGNSHSAAIVLYNLQQLGAKAVTVFQRRPVRFAQWDAVLRQYRFSSTGLKALGAQFWEQWLEDTPAWLHFETLKDPDDILQYDFIIMATGYQQTVLPQISGTSYYDHRNEETTEIAPGMYGIGVPWPEKSGVHWAKDMGDDEGFAGEWLVAWQLFLKRSIMVSEQTKGSTTSSL